MSVAFSVSAFAEATPGEADNLSDILVTNPSAYEPRNDLYTVLMENKNINVSEKATIAMGSALLANDQSSTPIRSMMPRSSRTALTPPRIS